MPNLLFEKIKDTGQFLFKTHFKIGYFLQWIMAILPADILNCVYLKLQYNSNKKKINIFDLPKKLVSFISVVVLQWPQNLSW
jgi:hypothetical protein